MSEFGGLIRDAREKLGLSPHRVAELIGRGSGIVKAWERGRAVPTDPVVITSLAAVLALDESRLFRAAGIDPPHRQPHLTIEQELATIAPSRESRPMATPDAGTETTPEDVSRSVITQETQVPAPQPASATSAVTEYVARQAPSPASVPERARQERRVPQVTSEHPVAASYMDDPDERWSYRLRSVWTAAGVAALGVLMLWAGSRALDAFGDVWDALLSGL